MTGQHAARELINELARAHPIGCQIDARLLHAPAHTEQAHALALTDAARRENFGTLLENLAQPINGFDVVHERRSSEHAPLRWEGRPQPRLASFAFDRLDERRFLTANVGARAPPQMD